MINMRETKLLVQMIEQQLGRELAPNVRNAFLQVPRHKFVQQFYEQKGNSLSWDLVPATREKIYRDEALVTQIDERGMPGSSTSQPSVMAVQLEALALGHGQRVLEIGTGTGYNAALLGMLVGETGQVISIDIDEALVKQARQHLSCAEIHNVVTLPGDGFAGEAMYAPYDRILTTCGIRSVPCAWFDQLKSGGKLVGNWLTPLASVFISVEKTSMDKLVGGLLDLSATYMAMHARDSLPSKQKVDWTKYDTHLPVSLSFPNIETLLGNPAYSLLLHCFLPEIRKRYHSKGKQVNLYLLAQETAIQVQHDRLLVFGSLEIAELIQQCYNLYHQLGQPCITDYHITLQKQRATICVKDQYFHFPLAATD